MNISLKLRERRKFVSVFFFFCHRYSDFRSSTTRAQQLIKHLNLCPGQLSLRDLNNLELFLSLSLGCSALRLYAVIQPNKKRTAVFRRRNGCFHPVRPDYWRARSPERSAFIIKARSTFEPEGNMMPDSSWLQPEKLAEVSQLMVTRQKGNK